MPAILIHGVPDTHHVWDGVREHLTRSDVEAWDLPGFGSPRPEGFHCTKEEYVSWLIERLEAIGEPVDLVGHDWGCLLTARVASVRPDLIRTWAGSNGPVSAEYDWHPLAKLWQDPVAGDRWAKEYDAAAFAKDLTDNLQIPAEPAEQAAGRVDETMRDSILKLYRSALTVGAEWEPGLADLAGPSLVFWGAFDPVCPVDFGEKMAASVRATRFLRLDSSHWTPIQKPAEVAAALEEHWSSSTVRGTHDSLLGAWVLEDFSLTREGTVDRPLGERPRGMLHYAADGWMSALLTAHPDDAPFVSPFEETATGTVAYAGRWEREADGSVVHHVQTSHYAPWTGTDLVREVQFGPGRLELTAAGADDSQVRIVWRRADA